MSWTVEHIPEKGLALIVATGEIADEDGRAQVVETIRLLNEHQLNLVLVDCSDAETKASLPGLYHLPDYATELGAPWNLRIAVVVSKTRVQIEKFHFFELVFRNAGYDVRLFDDRAGAEGWLWQSPAVRTVANHFASA